MTRLSNTIPKPGTVYNKNQLCFGGLGGRKTPIMFQAGAGVVFKLEEQVVRNGLVKPPTSRGHEYAIPACRNAHTTVLNLLYNVIATEQKNSRLGCENILVLLVTPCKCASGSLQAPSTHMKSRNYFNLRYSIKLIITA